MCNDDLRWSHERQGDRHHPNARRVPDKKSNRASEIMDTHI